MSHSGEHSSHTTMDSMSGMDSSTSMYSDASTAGDMGDDMSMSTDSGSFCNMENGAMVMLSGLQSAAKSSTTCILYLFEGAEVDTEVKYVFAVIGTFLMAFTSELLRYGREQLAKGAFPGIAKADHSVKTDLIKASSFAVQMLLAYFLMLLVMTFEYVLLVAIVLGLSVGHMLTLRLASWRRDALEAAGRKTPPEASGSVTSGAPCCNAGTTA